jgi:hypothetical protein
MKVASIDRAALAAALDAAGADGWLLYDFQGVNPVLAQVLGITGMASRRLFVLLPREGEPVAVAHKIELQSVAGFPGKVLPYARWEELHAALTQVVAGRRLAMEIAPKGRRALPRPRAVRRGRAPDQPGCDHRTLGGAGDPLRLVLERGG